MPLVPTGQAPNVETGVGINIADKDNDVIKLTVKQDKTPDFCICAIQCVPDLPVFTDEIGTDYYKNDLTSVFMPSAVQGGAFSSFTSFTKKIINADTGTETTLADSTHGTYYPCNYAKWFIVDWHKIYNTLGYGRYYMELKEVSTVTGDTLNITTTNTFRLKKYSDERAHGTIRLEIEQSGKIKNGNDYSNLKDYTNYPSSVPLIGPFTQQVRLPGRLKFTGSETENDHLVLDDANRTYYQVKDQERPTYELNINGVAGEQISSVLFDSLFSTPVKVSDYNLLNHVVDPGDLMAKKYRSIPLKKDGISVSSSTRRRRATYTISLKYANDNIFKTNN